MSKHLTQTDKSAREGVLAAVERSPWMLRPEAAAYARVHPVTLDRARKRGELTASRVGGNGRYRYHRADLDRWLGVGRLRLSGERL